MDKPKRTAALNLHIIKKLKNISIVPSNPNPSVDAHMEITNINLNQHAISSSANEMTTPLSPKDNRSSMENNHEDLIDSTLSSKEGPSVPSVNC